MCSLTLSLDARKPLASPLASPVVIDFAPGSVCNLLAIFGRFSDLGLLLCISQGLPLSVWSELAVCSCAPYAERAFDHVAATTSLLPGSGPLSGTWVLTLSSGLLPGSWMRMA